MDILQRVEYNQLQQHHVEALSALNDLTYEVYSTVIRQAKPGPVPFDLPRGTPPVDSMALRHIGIFNTADNPTLCKTCAEVFYFDSKEHNILWVFSELYQLVSAQCKAREIEFVSRNKGHDPDSGEGRAMFFWL